MCFGEDLESMAYFKSPAQCLTLGKCSSKRSIFFPQEESPDLNSGQNLQCHSFLASNRALFSSIHVFIQSTNWGTSYVMMKEFAPHLKVVRQLLKRRNMVNQFGCIVRSGCRE